MRWPGGWSEIEISFDHFPYKNFLGNTNFDIGLSLIFVGYPNFFFTDKTSLTAKFKGLKKGM